jgi:putative SOS response-associated peptidase YedK
MTEHSSHMKYLQVFEKPNFNCGPGHRLPVLMKPEFQIADDAGTATNMSSNLIIKALRWGLVPSYTKAETIHEACKAGNVMINARSALLNH